MLISSLKLSYSEILVHVLRCSLIEISNQTLQKPIYFTKSVYKVRFRNLQLPNARGFQQTKVIFIYEGSFMNYSGEQIKNIMCLIFLILTGPICNTQRTHYTFICLFYPFTLVSYCAKGVLFLFLECLLYLYINLITTQKQAHTILFISPVSARGDVYKPSN